MFADASTREQIFSKVDQDELVNLAMTLADFYSPTGCEQEVAQFILDWFEGNGFHAISELWFGHLTFSKGQTNQCPHREHIQSPCDRLARKARTA